MDVFEHNPARLWDMPDAREFGQWHVVGLFNVDYDQSGEAITQEIEFEDLGLSAERRYLVYEFWSEEFLGVKGGGFTRTIPAEDCQVYTIVEQQPHPVLVSTNRHVRQMAYDVLDVAWDEKTRILSGASKVVGGDPYGLRIYAPAGYVPIEARAGDVEVAQEMGKGLVTVRFTADESADVDWSVGFHYVEAVSR